MQLNDNQLEDLNVLVKTDGYHTLVSLVAGMVSTHVEDIETIEELHFAKGQSQICEFLENLETYVEQAYDL